MEIYLDRENIKVLHRKRIRWMMILLFRNQKAYQSSQPSEKNLTPLISFSLTKHAHTRTHKSLKPNLALTAFSQSLVFMNQNHLYYIFLFVCFLVEGRKSCSFSSRALQLSCCLAFMIPKAKSISPSAQFFSLSFLLQFQCFFSFFFLSIYFYSPFSSRMQY